MSYPIGGCLSSHLRRLANWHKGEGLGNSNPSTNLGAASFPWGIKSLISFYTSRKQFITEKSGQELKERTTVEPLKNTPYWFISSGVLRYLSYIAQANLPKRTLHTVVVLLHQLAIKKMSHRLAHRPVW